MGEHEFESGDVIGIDGDEVLGVTGKPGAEMFDIRQLI